MNIKIPVCSIALGVLLFSAGTHADHAVVGIQGGHSGPITTTSATPLPLGQHHFSLDFQFLDFDPVSDDILAEASENDEDVHSTDSLSRTAINYAFGFSKKLTVGFSLPHVQRNGLKEAAHGEEHHEEEEGGEEHDDEGGDHHEVGGVDFLGDAGGLGDLQVFGVYGLGEESTARRSALIFGFKAPTGKTKARSNDGELLEVELQPGSGSWDVFFGLAHSRQLGKASFDTNVLYTVANKGARATNLGDIFNYNLSLAYPLKGGKNHNPTGNGQARADYNFSLVFEVNGEWRERVEIESESQFNTGGNTVFFSPGIKLTAGKWVLSGAVGIAYVNLNGIQSEADTRFLVNIGRSL